MNKFSKLFLALAASSMMLSSCSSDEPGAPNQPSGNEKGFHATLTLSLPAGSRSATVDPGDSDPSKTNAGFEIGNDSENNVGSAIVLLAEYEKKETGKEHYYYITSSLADASPATSNGNPVYNITFENGALASYADQIVYVFVYCNPNEALVAKIREIKAKAQSDDNNESKQEFVDEIGNSSENAIANARSFLMSNAAIHSTRLPSATKMENEHNNIEHAFPLGTVRVERATARFDFKETQYEGVTGKNLYPILDAAKATMGYVQLDAMALLNVANNYYYLPRVVNYGTGGEKTITICGQETPNNYVSTPFPENKKSPLEISWLGNNYSCTPQYVKIGEKTYALDFTGLDYSAINGFEGEGEDDDANWYGPEGFDKTGYHIWKYVTENTIPKYEFDDIKYYQTKGVTTGVVFKGHLVPADEESDLGKVINGGTDVIYAYKNVIYGNLAMLKAVVLENPVSSLADVFKTAYDITEQEGKTIEEQINAVTADLLKTSPGGLTIYRPTNGKYEMYYTYYNRHNDNGSNTIMGPMEFSVVRNNIYKLSVSNILEFGHPGDPGDDPDPEDPDDPDETPKTYFTVQAEVIPWVVRINNIVL